MLETKSHGRTGVAGSKLKEARVKLAERGFDIGDRLYALRHGRALTQVELAEEAGVHPITISDIERGARPASARTVRQLAKALKVDVEELTNGSA